MGRAMNTVHPMLASGGFARRGEAPTGSALAACLGRWARLAMLASVLVFLCHGPVFAGSAAETAQDHGAKFDGVELAATLRYAHPVVTGVLGPWSKVRVHLVQSTEVDDAPFVGMVEAHSEVYGATVHALPPIDETEANFMTKVSAVMFRDTDRADQKDLLILYAATRIGPQQPSYFSVGVFRWNGKAFVRVKSMERLLRGARTGDEVDQRLVALRARSKN